MNKILTTAAILASVKFFSLSLVLSKHYIAFARNGYSTITPVAKILFAVLTIFLVWKSLQEFKESSKTARNQVLFLITSTWLFLSLFVNTTTQDFNYITAYINGYMSWEHFSNCITLDLIYDSPHILFWVIFIIFSVIILKNYKLERYYLIPFLLPFIDLFTFNSFFLINSIATLSAACYALKSRNNSYNKLTFFILINFLIHSIVYYLLREKFVQIFPLCFIHLFLITFAFIHRSICKNNNLKVIGWLMPAFLPIFIFHCSGHCYCGHCLTETMTYFNFYFGAVLIQSLIVISISNYMEKFNKILGNLCYMVLLFMFSAIYMLDSFVYYSSRMKIDLNTIGWMFSMNNLDKLFNSAKAYINVPMKITAIAIILSVPIIIILMKRFKTNTKKNNFLVIFFVYAHVGFLLYYICQFVTIVAKDPFLEITKKPINELLKKSFKGDFKKEFTKYDIDLKKYNRKISFPQKPKFNLIHITLESVHWRYLSLFGDQKTWPLISTLKDRMELFTNIYSNFPESGNGDFSVLSGLYSPNYQLLRSVTSYKAPTLANDLKNSGYECRLYASANLDDGNITALANPSVYSKIQDCLQIAKTKKDKWDWGVKEKRTVEYILEEIPSIKNKPFFIWYRMIYPHQPLPFTIKNLENEYPNPKDPEDQTSKYKIALRYIDEHLWRLITSIDNMDVKYPTIISLAADHGEMLGEAEFNKDHGHGISLDPSLTYIPFIVIKPKDTEPKGLKTNNRLGSQVDISDTLLDFLNIEPTSNRYSQGQSLISSSYKQKPIYFSSFRRIAAIEGNTYYEFNDPDNWKANVFKIEKGENYKMRYTPIASVSQEILETKRKRISDYYKLQDSFLKELIRENE